MDGPFKVNSFWRENHIERESFLCHKFLFRNLTISNFTNHYLSLAVTSDPATPLVKMEVDHPDTVPGFMMQSQNFVLKFITGMQKGVISKLLEMETDWFVCDVDDFFADVIVIGDVDTDVGDFGVVNVYVDIDV